MASSSTSTISTYSSPADQVLLELLHAAQESCASSSSSSSSNLDTIRSIVLKALSEPDLFYGYQQLARVIQQQQQPATASTASSTSSTSTSSEGERLLKTLHLFSYGTYMDYEQNPSLYLRLSDAQIYKLRQLTVMTLVQQKTSSSTNNNATATGRVAGCRIPYIELERALGFPSSSSSAASTTTTTTTTASSSFSPLNNTMATDENISTNNTAAAATTATVTSSSNSNSTRQVEEIVTSCLYAGVVTGKLCQKTKSFRVTSATASATPGAAKSTAAVGVGGQNASAAAATSTAVAPRSATCRDICMDTDITKMLSQIQQLQRALQASTDALSQEQAEWTRVWQATEMDHVRLAQQLESSSTSSQKGGGGGGRGGGGAAAAVVGNIDAAAGRRQKRSRGGFGGGGGGGSSAGSAGGGGGGGGGGMPDTAPSPFLGGRFQL